jgi:hypothetical protein
MCRPRLNTAHVYKEDDKLALDVRSQWLKLTFKMELLWRDNLPAIKTLPGESSNLNLLNFLLPAEPGLKGDVPGPCPRFNL